MKKILVLILAVFSLLSVGCMKPYDVPEYVEIEPHQTAFLIPLVGDTTEQRTFASEEFLRKKMVGAKRIQVPHVWVQTGRMDYEGKYMPSVKVLLVERRPVTREWTEGEKEGTSVKNQGLRAETKESIGFMARMNCSAQIDEDKAPKYLYRYNTKSLEQVMDSEIRARIESVFVETSAQYSLNDFLLKKQEIMEVVRKNVIPYFEERGVTITVIGMKGDLTYENPKIQDTIDQVFMAEKEKIAQKDRNQTLISKAEADSQAAKLAANSGGGAEYQLKMKQLEIQKLAVEKWSGQVPMVSGGGSGNTNVITIPIPSAPSTVSTSAPKDSK